MDSKTARRIRQEQNLPQLRLLIKNPQDGALLAECDLTDNDPYIGARLQHDGIVRIDYPPMGMPIKLLTPVGLFHIKFREAQHG